MHHTAAHEALIGSFVTEGWSRKDAEFKAFRFRRCFPRQTDAERAAIRDRQLAAALAGQAAVTAKADAEWDAAAPRKAVA